MRLLIFNAIPICLKCPKDGIKTMDRHKDEKTVRMDMAGLWNYSAVSSAYSMSYGWHCRTSYNLAIDRWSRPPVPLFIAVRVACPSILSFLIQ